MSIMVTIKNISYYIMFSLIHKRDLSLVLEFGGQIGVFVGIVLDSKEPSVRELDSLLTNCLSYT